MKNTTQQTAISLHPNRYRFLHQWIVATVFTLGACAVSARSSAQTASSVQGKSDLAQALVWTKEQNEEVSRLYFQALQSGFQLPARAVHQDITGFVEAVIAWHVLEEPLPSSDQLPPWRLYNLCRLVLSLSPSDPESDGPAAVRHLAKDLAASKEHSVAANAVKGALQDWRRARGLEVDPSDGSRRP